MKNPPIQSFEIPNLPISFALAEPEHLGILKHMVAQRDESHQKAGDGIF